MPAAIGAALGLALSPVAAVALLVVVRVTLATAATVGARVPALRTAPPPGPRRLGTLAGPGAPLQPALLAPAREDESDLAAARRRRLAARTAQSVAPRHPPVPAAPPPRPPAARVPRYVDVRVLGQVQVDRAFEIMVLLTAAPPSGAEGAPIVLQVTEGAAGPTGAPPAAVRFEAPAFDVVIALDAALPIFAARDSGPARFVVQPRADALGVQAMTVVVQQGGAVLYRSTGRGTVAPARVAGTLHWERGGGEAAAGRQAG